MTVNNKSYFMFFRWLLVVLLLVIAVDITFSQLPGSLNYYFQNHIPAIVSAVIIFFLASIRVNYFSYEDDYEIIHIRSKSLIFGKFESMAQTRYEFPKRVVQRVELKKFLFQKKLIVFLKTQSGEKKIQKFDLSFLPVHKLKQVFNSLQKISDQNKALET